MPSHTSLTTCQFGRACNMDWRRRRHSGRSSATRILSVFSWFGFSAISNLVRNTAVKVETPKCAIQVQTVLFPDGCCIGAERWGSQAAHGNRHEGVEGCSGALQSVDFWGKRLGDGLGKLTVLT